MVATWILLREAALRPCLRPCPLGRGLLVLLLPLACRIGLQLLLLLLPIDSCSVLHTLQRRHREAEWARGALARVLLAANEAA